jgi:hypothetical protein
VTIYRKFYHLSLNIFHVQPVSLTTEDNYFIDPSPEITAVTDVDSPASKSEG